MEINEPKTVEAGVHYIQSQYPDKSVPIQLVFLFAGEGDLECKILGQVIALGYNIVRVWFVDKAYLGDTKVLGDRLAADFRIASNHVINGRTLMQRHTIRLTRPNTTITKENFFDVSNERRVVVFVESFETLRTLMEAYIDPSAAMAVLAIHPQFTGENKADIHEKFGGFFKWFFGRFQRPFAALKRQHPYIYVIEPSHIKDARSNASVYKVIRERIMDYTGSRGGTYRLIGGKKKYHS